MLVGDFNSITSTADRVSGNLDPTSMVLQSLLDEVGLIEPGGSKCYTYQHPAIAQSKSCLDRICVSRDLAEAFYTYTQWCTFSDHSAVCLNRQRLVRGPTQWRMPDDVLEQKDFDTVIQEAIMDHDLVDPVLNWELTKASIKWSTQEFTKFCRKQSNHKLTSLRKVLHSINACIYKGDCLEQDRLKVQDKIK